MQPQNGNNLRTLKGKNQPQQFSRGLSVQELKAMTALRLAHDQEVPSAKGLNYAQSSRQNLPQLKFQASSLDSGVYPRIPSQDLPQNLSIQDIKELTKRRLARGNLSESLKSFEADYYSNHPSSSSASIHKSWSGTTTPERDSSLDDVELRSQTFDPRLQIYQQQKLAQQHNLRQQAYEDVTPGSVYRTSNLRSSPGYGTRFQPPIFPRGDEGLSDFSSLDLDQQQRLLYLRRLEEEELFIAQQRQQLLMMERAAARRAFLANDPRLRMSSRQFVPPVGDARGPGMTDYDSLSGDGMSLGSINSPRSVPDYPLSAPSYSLGGYDRRGIAMGSAQDLSGNEFRSLASVSRGSNVSSQGMREQMYQEDYMKTSYGVDISSVSREQEQGTQDRLSAGAGGGGREVVFSESSISNLPFNERKLSPITEMAHGGAAMANESTTGLETTGDGTAKALGLLIDGQPPSAAAALPPLAWSSGARSRTSSSSTFLLSSDSPPLSPKSMKNRHKLPLNCPPAVRSRTISDSSNLPFEMVESVLNVLSSPQVPPRQGSLLFKPYMANPGVMSPKSAAASGENSPGFQQAPPGFDSSTEEYDSISLMRQSHRQKFLYQHQSSQMLETNDARQEDQLLNKLKNLQM